MIKEIETRRSVRKYSNKPVEDEKILKLIESARLAPSGRNKQPWHFIIVKSESTKQKISKVSHDQKWMNTAPIHIVCVADIRERIEDDIEISLNENSPQPELKIVIRDVSIAIEHMVLEAEKLGLGTCWVAWFTQEEIRPILNIPEDKYVVAVIPVGYADEITKPRPRKNIEEIIHYGSW